MTKKPLSVGARKTVPQGTLCPTCGKIHQKCAAHRRKIRDEDGKPIPCNQPVSHEQIHVARAEGRGAVCRRYHGGNKLVGPANPNYKHGKKANPRYLPSRLLQDADRIGSDPELGSMKHGILVQELRIEELMRKLDDMGSSATSDEIQESLTDALQAIEIGDLEEAAEFVQSAIEISRSTHKAEKVIWDEIRRTHKILTTMVDSERKRQIVVQDFVPRRQLVLLAREMAKTANKYIPDPHAFSQFTIEMASKMGASRDLDSSSSLDAEFRRLDDEHKLSVMSDGMDDDTADNMEGDSL